MARRQAPGAAPIGLWPSVPMVTSGVLPAGPAAAAPAAVPMVTSAEAAALAAACCAPRMVSMGTPYCAEAMRVLASCSVCACIVALRSSSLEKCSSMKTLGSGRDTSGMRNGRPTTGAGMLMTCSKVGIGRRIFVAILPLHRLGH